MPLEHCPICGLGHLHPVRLTYAQVYSGTLVHFPNVPALRCDVCHRVTYDEAVLRRLEVLIGQAGPPPNHGDAAAPRLVRGTATQLPSTS